MKLQKIQPGKLSVVQACAIFAYSIWLYLKFLRFILLLILLCGCLGQPDCFVTSTNLVKIAFKGADNKVREITFNSITVAGLTKVFYPNQKASAVELPVDPAGSEIQFSFDYEGRKDTLHLVYEKQTELISKDCGAFTRYVNLQVAGTTFSLFNVVSDQLIINAPVNVEIRID